MAVPDFQSIMQPLLQLIGDGREHTSAEAREVLAKALGLTEDDLREMLPSGTQRRFDNRVGWAVTYLRQAGLLDRTGRGRYAITERGKAVLRGSPPRITVSFLKQFPEFILFHSGTAESPSAEGVGTEVMVEPPEEVLSRTYVTWKKTFATELLDRVKSCSPEFFEQLVIDLLSAMGYGGSRRDAAQAVGGSGDGGVDGVIKEDRLGLDVIYVQAKRWDGVVSRPVVQGFAGSLEGYRAKKGVLITTSTFTRDARDYVERIDKRIILIDGTQLAELMVDNGIGVTETASYVVRRIDSDYFGEQ